jgi:hypothetical protein
MWRIAVRISGSSEWASIWSGAGPDAERDARAQFARVCARLDGVRARHENMYAETWVAARLDAPDGSRSEYERAARDAEAKRTERPGADQE